ncbi:hypothetical protein PAPYR_7213 [Paratrimastix pyriformis]|uniref:Replication protein A OB domain-containing protein n=1 Tax=Paratrimastix pyriformis TaxID=342808 RepID=A0ABQ8UFY9_9EUKA|nr:hypothetical protein PAPYR_7213 [Paratrimastix pyriformis]
MWRNDHSEITVRVSLVHLANRIEFGESIGNHPDHTTWGSAAFCDQGPSLDFFRGQTVSVVGLVVNIFPSREVTTKSGKQISRQTLKLSDATGAGMLTVWGDQISQIQTVIPQETILQATGVAVKQWQETVDLSTTFDTTFQLNPPEYDRHAFALGCNLDTQIQTSPAQYCTLRELLEMEVPVGKSIVGFSFACLSDAETTVCLPQGPRSRVLL